MTKRFCDKCGKELTFSGAHAAYQTEEYASYFRVRHIDVDIEPDLCNDCLNNAIAEFLDYHFSMSNKKEEST